jgi:hypothetical protein
MNISSSCRPRFRKNRGRFLCGVLGVGLAVQVVAQNVPRIGYVFPAGGQVGRTIEVLVGGQFLGTATNVIFSGPGIQATVVDFHKPMNQGAFNLLRDQVRELEQRKAAWTKATQTGAVTSPNPTNTWSSTDDQKLTELREKLLKNPPNRNATPALAEVATLRIQIDANAAPGEREIRLASAVACSNPRKFWVGVVPEISQSPARGTNPEADRLRERFGRRAPLVKSETVVRLNLPTVINGQIMPGKVDRYWFRARRGQQLVLRAQARELIPYLADAVPGWFQAALTLRDAKGQPVAYNDDYRFRPDPILHYEVAADGDYELEIKDAIYRGREDFVYRINVGELPHVTDIFPLGGLGGQDTEVTVTGWNLATNQALIPGANLPPGIHLVPVHAGGLLTNHVAFALDELPEQMENEPNNTPETAEPVSLACIINGRIGQPGDVDVFKIHGRAGETIVAEVLARRLDSPLDSVLRFTDAAGRQLALSDDLEDKGSGLNTHHADSYLMMTLPAEGDYFLRIADTQGKGGSQHSYRMRLSPPRPDFVLRVTPSALNFRARSTTTAQVHVLRRDGFTNAVALTLKDAPLGVTLSGGNIPAGKDSVQITLKAPVIPVPETFRIELEGHARIGDELVVRPVTPADDLMQAFFYRHLVPAQELMLTVAGPAELSRLVKVASAPPVRIPVGGTARLKVNFPRGPVMDRMHFKLSDAPTGISIKEVVPTRAGTEIILQCDASTPPAELADEIVVTAVMPAGWAGSASKHPDQDRDIGPLSPVAIELLPANPATTKSISGD